MSAVIDLSALGEGRSRPQESPVAGTGTPAHSLVAEVVSAAGRIEGVDGPAAAEVAEPAPIAVEEGRGRLHHGGRGQGWARGENGETGEKNGQTELGQFGSPGLQTGDRMQWLEEWTGIGFSSGDKKVSLTNTRRWNGTPIHG